MVQKSKNAEQQERNITLRLKAANEIIRIAIETGKPKTEGELDMRAEEPAEGMCIYQHKEYKGMVRVFSLAGIHVALLTEHGCQDSSAYGRIPVEFHTCSLNSESSSRSKQALRIKTIKTGISIKTHMDKNGEIKSAELEREVDTMKKQILDLIPMFLKSRKRENDK